MASGPCFAKTSIAVGGYVFPPFVAIENGKSVGLTIDLIKLLNEVQKKFHFTFKLTSPRRRYRDFEEGVYDLIFFENLIWGWHGKKISATEVILKGGEIFVAKAQKGRDQSFFNPLSDKLLLGILGYHYQFANFNTDRKLLKDKFNLKLSTNHKANLNYLLNREGLNVAIVTKSYFDLYLKKHPELRGKFLTSTSFDQVYNHSILVRNKSTISLNKMTDLMTKLKESNKLELLWKKYGIQENF